MLHDGKQFVFVERKKTLQLAESCGLGIVEEEAYLVGYQIYIIEQWLCDRSIASNTIKVFTGDQNHFIRVCVIRISTAELQHPRPEIQAFFNTHTPLKFKPTCLGEIMLTDPSELPFDMDMVLVPDGDYDKWINQAYVNINLRRTNCTGRSALNLRKPNPASEEKFRSIYKIAETVPFEQAVINLVRLAQIALYLFNLLKKEYIDGLICNETTQAFWQFYIKYHPHKSPEYQLKEPWMEPHLLAALISKLVLCRNKLHAYNFTTIKDPFADYEHFRFDIEEYQRAKNLRRTKMIDLETLDKLNEYTVGQLKVRNVIKSKLDDISGISNSSLSTESSDPEVFRHHATIESLRAIWRPRLKNTSASNTGSGHLHHHIKSNTNNNNNNNTGGTYGGTGSGSGNSGELEKHHHEIMHMIKGVSARTTRTSGAAAEMISKFAGSFHVRSNSNRNQQHPRIIPPSPPPPQLSPPPPPSGPLVSRNSSSVTDTSVQVTDPSGFSTVEDILHPPSRTTQIKVSNTIFENPQSSDDELYNSSYRSDSDIPPWRLQAERQDNSVEQLQHELVPSPSSIPSSDGPRSDVAIHDVADFTPVSHPHRIPRRTRSVSDSIVPVSIFFSSSTSPGIQHHDSMDDDMDDDDDTDDDVDDMIPFHRTHSLTMIPTAALSDDDNNNNNNNYNSHFDDDILLSDSADEFPSQIQQQRPAVTMDIQTYLLFEKLQRQHTLLSHAYKDLRQVAHGYEERANNLRTTYLRRSAEFEQMERAAKQAMEEQHETELRLKDAEDGSAKLHYELNVLNENLKDVEDNVSTFYDKVSLLEHKMHDSQQSITTMLIIGNYFDYYWRKVKGWLMGSEGFTTGTDVTATTTTTTTTPQL
ncbi:hypothetical protein INT45_005325 [Circinella minor]|uniref:STB6-like N-terminal domain-containing protein n=1 Tax=Circinella minor TaxID=1195481 RepID=A0A8H7S8Z1_9FUNG|nr:hypothetical protein INT45_005325 [Circinella minor]